MASRNTYFKPRYSEKERQECLDWFEANMLRLPQKLLIDESIATNDLHATVRRLLVALGERHMTQRSTFCGYMSQLLRIRALVEPQLQKS